MFTRSQFQRILRAVASGKTARLPVRADGADYIRQFRPQERLILLGGGHIALPLCQLGSMLGFAVTVVDDRPMYALQSRFPQAERVLCADFTLAIPQLDLWETDYVVVVTHGHRWDADCLRALLPGVFPRYLGMVGSRRRVAALLHLLEQEGFEPARLEKIHAPIGLSIGALTPQEIAVSIAGELIQCRRTGRDQMGSQGVLPTEDADLDLLQFLAEDAAPKAVILAYDSVGSTPARAGAMMAVDREYRSYGTIGGGCGENAAMRRAFHLIGTGRSECLTVDMTEDVTTGAMACGGQLRVLIADLEMEVKDDG